MKLKSIANKIFLLYIILYTTRSFVHFALQCIYLTLKRRLQHQGNAASEELKTLIMQLASVMSKYGQIHRSADAATSVFYYSLLFFSPVFSFLIKTLSKGKYMDYFTEVGFISFIKKPELERENISKRIDACLQGLVESNVNYVRYVLVQSPRTSTRASQCRLSVDILQLNLSSRTTETSSDWISETTYESQHLFRTTLMESLSDELQYFTYLSGNKEKVWPPNRTRLWAKKITNFSLKLYTVAGSLVWLVSQVICCTIFYYVYVTVNENSHQNNFTFFDRLWCFGSYQTLFFF